MTRCDLHCSFICLAIYCVSSDSGRFNKQYPYSKVFLWTFPLVFTGFSTKTGIAHGNENKKQNSCDRSSCFLGFFFFLTALGDAGFS